MKKRLICKKGSYIVFLVFFFSGLMIMIGAVIHRSIEDVVYSSTENLGRLWGNSIIAEYDRELKERYGFTGYYGNIQSVKEKLELYSDYSFNGKGYIEVGDIECELEEFRLAEPEQIRKQIKYMMLSGWTPEKDKKTENEDEEIHEESGNRYISAPWILEALPSNRSGGAHFGDYISIGGAFEIEYIFKAFKDYVDKRELAKTYFDNEVEYIITGKPDDEKARKGVYYKLLFERNASNLIYLYSCSEKRTAAMTAAELLTPGPAAVLTQGLILETWALFEARNDIELLYAGEKVPLVKGDANWAIELDNVIKKEFEKDNRKLDADKEAPKYIKPERIEGLNYSEYLRTLLLTVSGELRILRIMDLIQINMKYTYCDYFLWEDYYTGLKFSIVVNGRKHEFVEEYK